MFLALPELIRDVNWHESEVSRLLQIGAPLDDNTQHACGHFDRIIGEVFSSCGEHPWSWWCVDDLWCESLSFIGSVATLTGIVYWLEGGDRCDRFRVDVDLSLEPLLYSYKFICSRTSKQTLYVAKTPQGWRFSA